MIPGPFEYHRPSSLGDAVALLGRLDDARLLAGGHSLIPMMKLRLAQPSHLIDLSGLAELRSVRVEGGDIVIGAMTTQHELIGDGTLAETAPIFRETAQQIADPQVRYLGTIGGNTANGDPGNDMPALMMALGATYVLRGPGGERGSRPGPIYLGVYETAARPDEILSLIRIPIPAKEHGWAYEKLKRKVGDYATAAAAVVLTVEGGRVTACAIGLTNVADRPLLAEEAAAAVTRPRARRGKPRPGRGGRRGHRLSRRGRPRLGGISRQDGRGDDRRALSRAFARATS